MKVCIPSMGDKGLDEQVGEHFGRVPIYTIYDSETKDVKIVPNDSSHTGGTGYPAQNIAKLGVDIMLCGGLGKRAITMFEEAGIMVYMGATGTVKDAIGAWEKEALTPATDETACAQHAFRGQGIGDGEGHDHGQDGCGN